MLGQVAKAPWHGVWRYWEAIEVAGAYKRQNTQRRVEGAFSYLNWRLCTDSCSTGSTRPDAGLRPPPIAAFGRSRPSAAVDCGSRPSAAAADRGIEVDAVPIHIERT